MGLVRYHSDGNLPSHPETLFVFGSNRAGRHGKGAALVARERFGARQGQGRGRQGQSWAIPTKDEALQTLPLHEITKEVDYFIRDLEDAQTPIADIVLRMRCGIDLDSRAPFAHRLFLTRIGCGLAGYEDRQIAPLLRGLRLLDHSISVPEAWRAWFEGPLPTYAGIGSRTTPPAVQTRMHRLAERLRRLGYILRSGGAEGADTAFAQGAGSASEIFLPWPGFNGVASAYPQPSEAAFRLAAEVHPAWNRLSDAVKKLMARNAHQILGPDLDYPVRFIVCWTPDGAETEADRSGKTGGTGQAIAMANREGIPVYNLANPDALERLRDEVLLRFDLN